MRNLKFRVWDTYLKKMSSGTGLTVAFKDGKLTDVSYEEETSSWSAMPDCLKQNRFITQQLIGLKDKNDVDVYEGDILNVKSYDDWFDKKGFNYKSIVFYCDETASFKHANRPEYKRGTNFILPVRGDDNLAFEVIGNIYENPELMEK